MVSFFNDTHDLWMHLKEWFCVSNGMKIFCQLKSQLVIARKDWECLAEYHGKFFLVCGTGLRCRRSPRLARCVAQVVRWRGFSNNSALKVVFIDFWSALMMLMVRSDRTFLSKILCLLIRAPNNMSIRRNAYGAHTPPPWLFRVMLYPLNLKLDQYMSPLMIVSFSLIVILKDMTQPSVFSLLGTSIGGEIHLGKHMLA